MVSSLGKSGTSFGVSARLSELAFISGLEVVECDVSKREVSSDISAGEQLLRGTETKLFSFLLDGDMQFPPSTLVDKGDGDLLHLSSRYSLSE